MGVNSRFISIFLFSIVEFFEDFSYESGVFINLVIPIFNGVVASFIFKAEKVFRAAPGKLQVELAHNWHT